MSGSRENSTTSAGSPPSTARDCSPDAAYDWLKPTPLPSEVLLKAGISSLYASSGVEYATSVSLPPPPPLLADDSSEVPPQPATSTAGRTAIARVSVSRRIRMRSIFHLVNRLCRRAGRYHKVDQASGDWPLGVGGKLPKSCLDLGHSPRLSSIA